MKSGLFFLLLLLFTFCVSAQTNKKLNKARNKQYTLPDPPNGVWLYDNVFIDETEIANIHWLEYMFAVKTDSSEAFYQSTLPYNDVTSEIYYNYPLWSPSDTSAYLYPKSPLDTLQKFPQEGDPYLDHYLRYPGFRYYPVVAITYEQALQYCQWRSEVVNNTYNQKLKEKGSNKRVYFHFRLPTEEEWEIAAHGFDTSRQAETGYLQNKIPYSDYLKKGLASKNIQVEAKDQYIPNFNCYYEFPVLYNNHKLIYSDLCPTTFIYDSRPNAIGLYNMMGNVAEMTTKEGIAKGGSWRQAADSCYISRKQYYDCPNDWTGFRCICEVYEYSADSSAPVLNNHQERASQCSEVIERNEDIEYKRRAQDPEFVRMQLISFGEQYSDIQKGKLFINGSETYQKEIIVIDSAADKYPKWSIENTTPIDSAEIQFCRSSGYNRIHPFHRDLYKEPKNSSLHPPALKEDQAENIFGLFILVYYQENGKTRSEYFYRVMEFKP